MRLESVRDLKAQLLREVVSAESRELAFAGDPGIAARRMPDRRQPRRTIALGVAPAGGSEFRLAVRVQRRRLENSDELEHIRSRARGEVDVQYIGRVFKQQAPWHRAVNRPLLIGGSVGHHDVTAGTLGAFVTLSDGSVGIISNNHVLADENRGIRGDVVLQPGSYDGGTQGDRIGVLENFVELSRDMSNRVDAATARLDDGIAFEEALLAGVGDLAGLGDPSGELDEDVAKLGRTTGHTSGRISAIEVDGVVVRYDMGNITFDGQVEIDTEGVEPFSDGGDSGSLIFTPDRVAVALLFAGSDQGGRNGRGVTYASPLGTALDALSARLRY